MSFLDTIFAKKQLLQAKVLGKQFVPESTYNTLMPQYIGKTLILIPMQCVNEEKYLIQLELLKQVKEIEISKEKYEKLQINEIVEAEYKIGSFTQKVYVKKIK